MTKKIIISDANIIIYLSAGDAFSKFCLEFDVCVTKEIFDEINNGRASKTEPQAIFHKQYSQGRVTIYNLNEEQQVMRDKLMRLKTKIGIGESSCIAATYKNSQCIFATHDSRALEIASDILELEQIINFEEILIAMTSKQLLSDNELAAIRVLMNS